MKRENKFLTTIFYLVVSALTCSASVNHEKKPPNIVFILADDMGWNDVSWHGSWQIPTPNIDALAMGGIILNKLYSQPLCTPSRAALLTGKYPIRMGMQHGLLLIGEPRGLPLTETLLPQYLAEYANYSSHIVGKWHLGFHKAKYTPTFRGFQSHLGYWNGAQDYNDHTVQGKIGKNNMPVWGYDMRRNMDVALDLHGKYSTDIFTNESVSIIENHDFSQPLFLFVSQIAPHTGSSYNPFPVQEDIIDEFQGIENLDRRRYAGLVRKLDDGIGKIVEALQEKGILNNTIIVFQSDNGGPVEGYMGKSSASNWPLRGSKRTLWEGGVRVPAVIWAQDLPNGVHNDLFHVTDWLPTLLSAAGVNSELITGLDGIDQWAGIVNERDIVNKKVRKEILLNTDPIEGTSALIQGKWKIIKGISYQGKFDGHFGPSKLSALSATEYYEKISSSTVAKALMMSNTEYNLEKVTAKWYEVQLQCSGVEGSMRCNPLEAPCLFNLDEDPCEENNLAPLYPDILKKLDKRLKKYSDEQVQPTNMNVPECANPSLFGHIWVPYADIIDCPSFSDRYTHL